MHSFLRSVGFSKIIRDADIYQYLQMTIDAPDMRSSYQKPDGETFVELKKEFGYRTGLAVCGCYLDQSFHVEYFYPYFRGSFDSTQEEIEIQRHADKHSYAAVCDDLRMGITLIYYLQNISDFFKHTDGQTVSRTGTTVLAALSTEGKIILPVERYEENRKKRIRRHQMWSNLVTAARDGDQEAIDNLTIEDVDTYSIISQRIASEDLFSIVETCMMPYGVESDQYSVIGEILDVNQSKNMVTGENMVIMTVCSKDIIYDICINEADLLGEPQIGRRFKGKIWMQGMVKF